MDLSIVTITYNEKENIGKLIETLNRVAKENKIKNEIVIVDDNSPDGTADIIKEYIKKYRNIILIQRPKKLGIGSAYGDGVKISKGNVIITMDADFSHPPDKIAEMYFKAKEGYMVTGSRFIEKKGFKTLLYRKIGTTLLNLWIKLLFNINITDYSNGYIAIKKEYMGNIINYGKKINIYPYDYVLYGIPIFIIGRKLGYQGTNVFAPYIFREYGKTKIPFFEGLKIWLKSIFLTNKLFFKLFKQKI